MTKPTHAQTGVLRTYSAASLPPHDDVVAATTDAPPDMTPYGWECDIDTLGSETAAPEAQRDAGPDP
ncbi:hypothetical protein [Nocardia sp. NPDC052112]|uniref:hypothetical protein n=1 Tax=Nocardia sp. NPDC052112 TaxID=3155646 RepID=UPI00342FAA45